MSDSKKKRKPLTEEQMRRFGEQMSHLSPQEQEDLTRWARGGNPPARPRIYGPGPTGWQTGRREGEKDG